MKPGTCYVEGYGCALNTSETEKILGLLCGNSWKPIKNFREADLIVINTCAVKAPTEQRMLSRISKLFEDKKPSAKLIVFGCLAKTRKEPIKKISKKIVVLDTKLSSLCKELKIIQKEFSPELKGVRKRAQVSIVPVATGCVGDCSYCITKLAREKLESYPVKKIVQAFKKAVKESKEIWITSQDLGCYGFDIGATLPELLKKLLKNNGNYFVRLGMMNPTNFKKISKKLMPIFEDDRVYKFLHLPMQSGSDKILKLMNRKYSRKDLVECIELARSYQLGITISTDVIVGFPGETKKDFQETISLLKKIKPNMVNISRYGKRPGTKAVEMENQLTESEKKERSRELSKFCRKLFLEQNKKLIGKEFSVLVSERAEKGFFTARNEFYRPILVTEGYGKFARAKITEAFPNFFKAEVLEYFD